MFLGGGGGGGLGMMHGDGEIGVLVRLAEMSGAPNSRNDSQKMIDSHISGFHHPVNSSTHKFSPQTGPEPTLEELLYRNFPHFCTADFFFGLEKAL
eukprot:COSAG02_NODE_2577_length_8495_cov_107.952477_2_plen_96_part_00